MGRWNDGRRFASARPVDHALRSMVAEQVTPARRRARGDTAPMAFAPDQGAISNEIGHRQALAAHESRTHALHEVYERETDTVDELVRAVPMPAQRAIAAGIVPEAAAPPRQRRAIRHDARNREKLPMEHPAAYERLVLAARAGEFVYDRCRWPLEEGHLRTHVAGVTDATISKGACNHNNEGHGRCPSLTVSTGGAS